MTSYKKHRKTNKPKRKPGRPKAKICFEISYEKILDILGISRATLYEHIKNEKINLEELDKILMEATENYLLSTKKKRQGYDLSMLE